MSGAAAAWLMAALLEEGGGGESAVVTVGNSAGAYGYFPLSFIGSISPDPFTFNGKDLQSIGNIGGLGSGSEFAVTFDGSPASNHFTQIEVQESGGGTRTLNTADATFTTPGGGIGAWSWPTPFNSVWNATGDRNITMS